jgi:AcrR family transcriptional regulator
MTSPAVTGSVLTVDPEQCWSEHHVAGGAADAGLVTYHEAKWKVIPELYGMHFRLVSEECHAGEHGTARSRLDRASRVGRHCGSRRQANAHRAGCVRTRSATSTPSLRRRRPSSTCRAWTRPPRRSLDLAGVGVGTLYRHFPQRSDLVKAVFQREVDACAAAAPALAAAHEPGTGLAKWLHRYTEFLATKRGLAAALHSGDPAYGALPGHFVQRLEPALGSLLEAAAACCEIRADIRPGDLLHAVANLCLPVTGEGIAYNQRMVALLIDGLRYGAGTTQ